MFLSDGLRIASPMFSLENYGQITKSRSELADRQQAERRYLSDDLGTLRAIGRLRYELFIERDGKKYEHADHRNRLFLEPVDFVSLNFSVGTKDSRSLSVRMTHAHDARADTHLKLIPQHSGLSDEELAHTVVLSRLAVRDDIQSKMQIPNVIRTVYEAGLSLGAKNALLAARQQMLALFDRFGFIRTRECFEDAVAGSMHIMRLDMTDRENLIACRSPLLKTHDQFFQHQEFVPQEEIA
ncbi:putative GNAT family N-acyltransferase [Rhizobium aquaticum]|uniref:GNAT family N-acyltransferase n=1 Tax=Rhizobium aquaticum TaxID=1549636 RepID=A0ABV2J4M6_9HYPH